mmetsp:Transcript_14008/g.50297  ORF Transcript_14008/g.50297 Transcript_14008/m.50297 type:complete len:276 (-) Transcript_14008:158-985(-)
MSSYPAPHLFGIFPTPRPYESFQQKSPVPSAAIIWALPLTPLAVEAASTAEEAEEENFRFVRRRRRPSPAPARFARVAFFCFTAYPAAASSIAMVASNFFSYVPFAPVACVTACASSPEGQVSVSSNAAVFHREVLLFLGADRRRRDRLAAPSPSRERRRFGGYVVVVDGGGGGGGVALALRPVLFLRGSVEIAVVEISVVEDGRASLREFGRRAPDRLGRRHVVVWPHRERIDEFPQRRRRRLFVDFSRNLKFRGCRFLCDQRRGESHLAVDKL